MYLPNLILLIKIKYKSNVNYERSKPICEYINITFNIHVLNLPLIPMVLSDKLRTKSR